MFQSTFTLFNGYCVLWSVVCASCHSVSSLKFSRTHIGRCLASFFFLVVIFQRYSSQNLEKWSATANKYSGYIWTIATRYCRIRKQIDLFGGCSFIWLDGSIGFVRWEIDCTLFFSPNNGYVSWVRRVHSFLQRLCQITGFGVSQIARIWPFRSVFLDWSEFLFDVFSRVTSVVFPLAFLAYIFIHFYIVRSVQDSWFKYLSVDTSFVFLPSTVSKIYSSACVDLWSAFSPIVVRAAATPLHFVLVLNPRIRSTRGGGARAANNISLSARSRFERSN